MLWIHGECDVRQYVRMCVMALAEMFLRQRGHKRGYLWSQSILRAGYN